MIDPPGKTARTTSIGPDARSQPALHRSHQVVNLGEALDGQGIDHADSAVLTDATQIIALEVDDHGQLGPILGRPGQLLRPVGDLPLGLLPRGRVPLMGRVTTRSPRVW